jgi:diketogulonate reductase-like aldo/keto reductase
LVWGLEKGVVVIPKASSENHLKENLGIFGWKLSKEDIKRIDSLNKNKRFVNPIFSDFNY